MSEQHQYRGGLVWPVILIGAGIVFLLNNLGVLDWSVWGTLWRLWPVLLIAAGLDMLIGRRSLLGSALVALLLLAVLGLAVGRGLPQWGASGVSTVDRTESISQDLKGAERAEVEIGFGTGTLNLSVLPEGSPQLIKGTLDLSRGESLTLDHSGAGAVERLLLKSNGTWTGSTNIAPDERKTWDLELNRDIPINLKIGIGVGRSILDLTQINLTGLEINGGVGEASVKLPARGRFDVNVDGGLGQITLIIPQGLAASIQVDGGLGGIRVAGDFDRDGEDYVSPGYSTAEHRANITIDGGIGQIVIREVVE